MISALGPLRKEIPFLNNNSSNDTVKTLKFIFKIYKLRINSN